MKHSSLILVACCLFAVFFAGCETIGGTHPWADATKLWPAYDNATHKWGYINAKGKMVIPAQYDEANGFSCGYALVQEGNQSHYIDKHGAIQHSFNGTNCRSFYYGYAGVEQDRKQALVNKKFEYVIQPGEYKGFGNMSYNGLIPAYCKWEVHWGGVVERQGGYANTDGELVLPCQYNDLSSFTREGYAMVSKMGIYTTSEGDVQIPYYGIIDTNGNEVLPCIYSKVVIVWDENTFLYYDNSAHGWGICNKNGEVISAPELYVAYKLPVDEGLIGVRNTESRWGYMDSYRNLKIDYQYDEVSQFSEGYAFAMNFNDSGEYMYTSAMINAKGDTICSIPGFTYCPAGFHNGLALIGVQDSVYMYKYINTKGKIIYEWESEGSVFNSPADNTSNTDDTEGMQWLKKAQEFTEQTLHFSSVRLMND